MTPSTSRSYTYILLFYLLFPFIHASCPKCPNGNNGHVCDCESNCYREIRQNIMTCQRCTEKCSEDKNQVEVTPCTEESNRVCFCKPGFYCEKKYNYITHCHKPCVPCPTGTFSSKPSLVSACTRHKDCAKLGMKPNIVGSTTRDNECGYSPSKMAALTTPSSMIDTIYTDTTSTLRTGRLVIEGTAEQDGESVYSTTKMAASSTSFNTNNSISSNTTSTLRRVTRGSLVIESTATQDEESVYTTTKMAASSTSSSTNNTTSSNTTSALRREGTPLPIDQDEEKRESRWLLLLILLLMLLFMTGFCMLMKGKAMKTLSKCFGFIKGEHEEQQHSRPKAGDHQIWSNSNSSTDMETKIPLGSNVREVKGQTVEMTPQSGVVQQVTVEHNGRGENVNNTVGSIYIYSPGMVILGSNKGDKKEEVCEEARPLIGSPQQESNPPSQEVRIRMSAQEEAEEELSLSFPVPATGK